MKNVLNPTLRDTLRSPFGAASGAPTPGDPLWADVSFLINFMGAAGTTIPTDAKGNSLTYYGGAVLATDVYPAGALDLGTVNSIKRVEAPDSSAFELPGAFCLEIEAYSVSGNTFYNILFDTSGNGSFSGGFGFECSTIRGIGMGAQYAGRGFVSTTKVNDSIKHRYTLDREADGTCRIFIDGEVVSTFTYTPAILSNGLCVGQYLGSVDTSVVWKGHIAAVRLTRASRYTANHTPPALPFPEGP